MPWERLVSRGGRRSDSSNTHESHADLQGLPVGLVAGREGLLRDRPDQATWDTIEDSDSPPMFLPAECLYDGQ